MVCLHFLYQVHERDQDTDFSLLVVRKLLRTNSRHTRVVLMSATFDSDMFANYFALPVRDQLEPAPIVTVDGRPYEVKEFYTEQLQALGEVLLKSYKNLMLVSHFFMRYTEMKTTSVNFCVLIIPPVYEVYRGYIVFAFSVCLCV